jgi:hypothetical protein
LILPLLLLAAAGPAASVARMPPDVRRFIARRQSCTRWAGEEPYDQARAREIESALRQDQCNTIEATEARLRRRYAPRPDVLRALAAMPDGD